MTPKCTACGKFSVIVDSGVPFGTYGDLEPPEEELWCADCAEMERSRAVAAGWIPYYYINPQWVLAAANESGHIEVRHKEYLYSFWRKKDQPLPEDLEVVNC